MKKIMVLGSGMVGSVISAELSKDFNVTAVDIDSVKLKNLASKYQVKIIEQDLTKKGEMKILMKDQNIIVNAVPGFMGYRTLEMIIESGKNAVDISFFPEDPFRLNELAVTKGVTAVVDCGVAPGLSNILLGFMSTKYQINTFKCYVGGLPFERIYPYQYKAPFSPADVIEEYTRPARYFRKGKIVTMPPLSEPELLNFEGVGTLEAFNSDGLRSLLITMDIPDMVEKTLRYPGHREAIKLLNDSGFFSEETKIINGAAVRPVDLSSQILFNHWKINDSDNEFTILRIIIGTDEKEFTFYMMDKRDYETGFSSMARTTGFTCTSVVDLMLNEKIKRKGICPPEYIGMESDNFEFILKYLEKRNIRLNKSERDISVSSDNTNPSVL